MTDEPLYTGKFCCKKVNKKKKIIPVLFSWYFFHYVNDGYTMRFSKLEKDSEVVNPKRKTKPLFINGTQEDDRFVIDEEYDIVTEK